MVMIEIILLMGLFNLFFCNIIQYFKTSIFIIKINIYMETEKSRNFREVDSVQLNDTISAIDISMEFLAVGCLDENLYMWNASFEPFQKSPILYKGQHTMGIVDLKFNKNSTHLAVSCLDACIRHWQIDSQTMTEINCQIMENWKLAYIGNKIVTCGDLGKISFFDNLSKQKVQKIDAGQVQLTSLTVSNDDKFLATGNDSGDLFIIKLDKKNKLAQLKPHHRIIRSLNFTEDSNKIITASDDDSLKIIDIASEKVAGILQGHKQGVSCVSAHPTDNRIVFSCSFDKSVKVWDLRTKKAVGSTMTGSPLWTCKATTKHLVAGGQNGVLSIFSIQ